MSLVPSLLQAIVRVDGDALVMHAGDKPYVVSPNGQVDLASRGLSLEAVDGIVAQLLSVESRDALEEFGAVQYELAPDAEFPGEHFTVVAARGGDDLWVEVRRRRVTDEDRIPDEFFSAPQADAVASGDHTSHLDDDHVPMELLGPSPAAAPVDVEAPAHAIAAAAPVALVHDEDLALPEPAHLFSDDVQLAEESVDAFEVEPLQPAAVVPLPAPTTTHDPSVVSTLVPPPAPVMAPPPLVASAPALVVPPPALVAPSPALVAWPPLVTPSAVFVAPPPTVVEPPSAPTPITPPAQAPVVADRWVPMTDPVDVEAPPSEPVAILAPPAPALVAPPPLVTPSPLFVAPPPTVVEPPPALAVPPPALVEPPPAPTPVPPAAQALVIADRWVSTTDRVDVEPSLPEPAAVVAPPAPTLVAPPPLVTPAPVFVAPSPTLFEPPPAPFAPPPASIMAPAPAFVMSPPAPVTPSTPALVVPPPAPTPVPPAAQAPVIADRWVPTTDRVDVEPSLPEPAAVVAPPAPTLVAPPPASVISPAPLVASQPAPVTPPPAAASKSPAAPPEPAVVLPMARNPIRMEPHAASIGDPTMDGLQRLLRISAARGASALYLSTDARPSVRVDGELEGLDSEPVLEARDIESLLLTLMPDRSHEALRTGAPSEWMCDIEDVGRVRCTTFRDHGGPGGVFRLMPTKTISADQLALPRAVQVLAIEPEGLILVVGPRSSGKRTLIAAFVDLINRTRRDHVITIEREVNIVHPRGSSFISQREVRGSDDDLVAASRAALREDPDVLVIEDLRTSALVNVALEAAASGRLVIGGFSAHTSTAAIDRIIDLYAPDQRHQVQLAIADTLRGVVAQVLLRKMGGGRIAAREVLLNTAAVSGVIAEGKTSQLPMAIEGGRRHGMMPLGDTLAALVQTGVVDACEAYRHATDRSGLVAALKRQGVDVSQLPTLTSQAG